ELALQLLPELPGLVVLDLLVARLLLDGPQPDQFLPRVGELAVELRRPALAVPDFRRDRADRLVEAVLDVSGALRRGVRGIAFLRAGFHHPFLDLGEAVAHGLEARGDPVGPLLRSPRGDGGKPGARHGLAGAE